ncbi:MAG: cytochrome c, partial [Verrucomicrobiota bacterium]
MRWFFVVLFLVICTMVLGYGLRGAKTSKTPFELFPDMDRQQKVKYQKPSDFFADGVGSRAPIEGTIPMGFALPGADDVAAPTTHLDFGFGDDYYNTGQMGDVYGAGFPENLTLDKSFLERGAQRYQIYCTPCHGESGNGQGIVSKYWSIPPTANLVDARAGAMPEGQIYWTITHG